MKNEGAKGKNIDKKRKTKNNYLIDKRIMYNIKIYGSFNNRKINLQSKAKICLTINTQKYLHYLGRRDGKPSTIAMYTSMS